MKFEFTGRERNFNLPAIGQKQSKFQFDVSDSKELQFTWLETFHHTVGKFPIYLIGRLTNFTVNFNLPILAIEQSTIDC